MREEMIHTACDHARWLRCSQLEMADRVGGAREAIHHNRLAIGGRKENGCGCVARNCDIHAKGFATSRPSAANFSQAGVEGCGGAANVSDDGGMNENAAIDRAGAIEVDTGEAAIEPLFRVAQHEMILR